MIPSIILLFFEHWRDSCTHDSLFSSETTLIGINYFTPIFLQRHKWIKLLFHLVMQTLHVIIRNTFDFFRLNSKIIQIITQSDKEFCLHLTHKLNLNQSFLSIFKLMYIWIISDFDKERIPNYGDHKNEESSFWKMTSVGDMTLIHDM